MAWRARIAMVFVLTGSMIPCAGEEPTPARKNLDKAIEAMGGKARLSLPGFSGSSEGKIFIENQMRTIRNDWHVQGLDKVKWASEVDLNGKNSFTLVVDGKQGWLKGNQGEANSVDPEHIKPFLHGLAALRIAESLVPLTDKNWKLSHLGDLKIDETMCVGIKASRKGFPDMDIYFDKASHLPHRVAMTITETTGREVPYHATFTKYKDVGGRKFFSHLQVVREDQLMLEMDRSGFKTHDQNDDSSFGKP